MFMYKTHGISARLPVFKALMTACRMLGRPNSSSGASSSSTTSPPGAPFGPADMTAAESQPPKPEPPTRVEAVLRLENVEEPPRAVVADDTDAPEVLVARPSLIAARRAAICSFIDRDADAAEPENPFSGVGPSAKADFAGEVGAAWRGAAPVRGARVLGEDAPAVDRTEAEVDTRGRVARGGVVGIGGLEDAGGLSEPLDFCARRAGVDGFLAREVVCGAGRGAPVVLAVEELRRDLVELASVGDIFGTEDEEEAARGTSEEVER